MDERVRQELVSIRRRLIEMTLEIDTLLTPALLQLEESRERNTLPAGPPDSDDGV